jgi:osmotically inducible protein OsmC
VIYDILVLDLRPRSEAEVPGIDGATFQECAENATKGCPVSKALAATPISL